MKARAVLLASILLAPFSARADDWSLTRPPGTERKRGEASQPGLAAPASTAHSPDAQPRLRTRYLRALLAEPTQQFALERLLALYRERDGNLDGLARELAQRTPAQSERYALWMLRGQVDAARAEREAAGAAYEEAAKLAPGAAAPLLARARLERERGEPARATALLEAALVRTTENAQRAELLRQLAELAFERQDFDAAEHYYVTLAAAGPRGVLQATAYARALAARGQHERAIAAYHRALTALRGDSRVLAPVLLELARSQLEASDSEGALASLARARQLAVAGTGVRYEVDELLVEVYRRGGRLAELAAQLASERTAGFAQSELLGRVYDELGDQTRALQALRKALAYDPGKVEARERVIRILSQQGELDQAIAEYRALLRLAPREPRFVIELAKLLMESGKRKEGLSLLDQTALRFPADARLQRSIFELFARSSENARATAILTRLSRIEPEDPSHFVALGEQLLEHGDQAGALAVWRKILDALPDKARAHAALASTYLDHDLPERALVEYEAALKLSPNELDYVRGQAETLEKLQRSGEAAERWQRVLQLATDRAQKREARRRVARLWAMNGELPRRVAELERALAASEKRADRDTKPAAAEAGRFLAECYRALASGRRRGQGDARYLDMAEHVLVRVLELEPGDSESMLALERLRALRGNLAGAIEILKRLLEADPKNAGSYLARMAEHALALYRDAEAIGYAERLVTLNPNDAKAHERLGDLYRACQSGERAIASYERAVALDENAFAVHLQLAELYLSRGESPKADVVLRRVVRACPDDELVKRATRSLIQLGPSAEHLSSLEQMLLPLALGNPQRPIYRALLVELYDSLARPWSELARERGPLAVSARAELRAIGQRAIQPLLGALADADPTQQRIAIDLLGQLHNEHAAAALLAAAEREGDTLLRRRALLATGAAAPSVLAGRVAALASAPERRLRDAAAWALARMAPGPAVVTSLRALRASNTPAVRGYALLGLGRSRDAASFESLREALRADRSAFVRGAAALALAMSQDQASAPALATALRTEQGETAAAVALSLGLLGDRTQAEPLAEAVFANESAVRRAGLWALRWLARRPKAPFFVAPELAEPDERLSLEPVVSAWLSLEPPTTSADAIRAFHNELRDSAEAALRGAPEATHTALALLSGDDPVLGAPGGEEALAGLVAGLRPVLLELAKHPDPAVRAAALVLIGSTGPFDATLSVLAALEDGDEQVRMAALDQIGVAGRVVDPKALERVATIAGREERWWMRLRAVAAIGRAGGELAASVLPAVLANDPYAYVREAAAAALAATRSEASVPALAAALLQDAEPRVRLAAARALQQLGGPAAAQALGRMDPQTRTQLQTGERRGN